MNLTGIDWTASFVDVHDEVIDRLVDEFEDKWGTSPGETALERIYERAEKIALQKVAAHG